MTKLHCKAAVPYWK